MSKNKKPEVNNEKLALMIGMGFEHMDKRFEKVDQRFEKVDKRFDRMDKRFDRMDKRFDRIESNLIVLAKGHEEIRLRQDQMAYRFELDEVKKRIDKVERKLSLTNR